MGNPLTDQQKDVIEGVQRASSVLSILGASFIIVTFLASPRFHKPINRLAFYAAIANILCTVATTIARAGPKAGQGSAMCNMRKFKILGCIVSQDIYTNISTEGVFIQT